MEEFVYEVVEKSLSERTSRAFTSLFLSFLTVLCMDHAI